MANILKEDAYNKKAMTIIPNPPIGYTWEDLMRIALDEAKKAFDDEEVPVGAVLVSKQGKILARAHNTTRKDCDPTAHAEIVALREAAKKQNNFRFAECYLVVTLEPCIMCLGALHEARIEGIIFGAYDKTLGAVCSCIEGTELPLNAPKAWFMGGILEEECSKILQIFFKERR